MKKLFQFLLIITILNSCYFQDERIENKLITCYNEPTLIKEILEYEKELVSSKILKNGEPENYIQLLKKIKANKEIDEIPEKISGILIIKRNKKLIINTSKGSECLQNIYKSPEFEKSKIYMINQQIANHKYPSVRLMAESLLNTLEPSDYKLPFYKLQVFKMLTIYNPESNYNRKFPPESIKSKNQEYAKRTLSIIIKKNEVLVNDKIVLKNQLRTIVYKYYKENKQFSNLYVITNKGVTNKDYFEIQKIIINEIKKLWNEYALDKYKVAFEKLGSEKQKKIKELYPLHFREKTLKK